jgi:hypothetical protein
MKENKTLIMLINWKWRKMTIVNDKYLEGISEEEILSTISSPSSNYFTVYDAQTNHANNAKVVATCIYKGEKTNQLLLKITEHLYNKYVNAKIYVFMHRGHHHTHEDVQDLLDKSEGKIEKCFLFSEGRDFIYYPTQKKGLLSDAGGFWRQDGVSVFSRNPETKQITILQPYLDNVWHYYDHEFRKKICELKQDFFDICMPLTFPNPSTEIAYKQFMDNFMEEAKKQNKELYLRFRSFLGVYDNLQKHTPNKSREFEEYAKLKKEWERLEEFEKKSKRSYILDDCSANLEHILPDNPQDQTASDCYLALKEKIQPLLCPNTSKPLPTFVTQGDLQNIRMLFRKLLDCLDGDEA